jgi:polar amino acid transport system substrate-binding protein
MTRSLSLRHRILVPFLALAAMILAGCGESSTSPSSSGSSVSAGDSAAGSAVATAAGGAAGEETGVASALEKIVVGTDAAYRPMEYLDPETNTIVGYDIDLMRALCEEAGLRPEFRNVPWDGLFVSLQTGEIDCAISSITITEERSKSMLFTDPYFRSAQAIVVREGDEAAYRSLDALVGKRVSVQLGTTGQFLAEERGGIELVKFESSPLALADLRNSNVVAAIIDLPVARFYAQNEAGSTPRLAVIEGDLSEEFYGIAVGKKKKDLVRRLNEALARLKEKGTIDQLDAKWF